MTKEIFSRLAIFFAAIFFAAATHAACSSYRSPQQKVWLNEYFFGSGGGVPPNFLEIYTTDNGYRTGWPGSTIEVYSAANTKTTYLLNNSNTTACTISNKTWITHNVLAGLRQQNALVILRDPSGDAIDAFVFDNGSPPAPWLSGTNNWAPGNTTGCTALDTALTNQSALSATQPKQANMLVLVNYGNKDMGRTPDGGSLWDLTSNTGAGTTYTQCVSNNANLTKVVDNTTPSPGGTVTFTLNIGNTGNTALSGVSVVDYLPDYQYTGSKAPSFISAIALNPLDVVSAPATYATTDPNTATAAVASKITWAPAAIAAGATAKLNIKMQVPANAIEGYTYLNTAETTAGLTTNQSDFASFTIGSLNVGSFVITASASTASTCTPATLAPKLTITAMTGPGGTGVVDTAYAGGANVYLFSSSPNPKFYNSAGTQISVAPLPSGLFVNGVATVYVTNATAESITVSALDTVTYSPNAMQGTSGQITYTGQNTSVSMIDADTLSPQYGVVSGRPHKVRATITSCGTTATGRTGSYSAGFRYTAGLKQPAGATAPSLSTSATCSGAVGPLTTGANTNMTMAFTAGVSDFYLCTSDVGQYALNLALTLPSPGGGTFSSVSGNFTVRPFVITAASLTAGNIAAGNNFSGTFSAWNWTAGLDSDGNGIPDTGKTAADVLAANPAKPLRFSGTTDAAGVAGFSAGFEPPASGTLATLTPSTATATAATVTLANLNYPDVGNIRIVGLTGYESYGAINYLGLIGLHVPLLGEWRRFIPAYFETAVTPGTGTFTYAGQPFTVTVTAKNAGGNITQNYEGAAAKDVTLSDANSATNNSATLGSFANATLAAASFTDGVATASTIKYAFTSKTTAPLEAPGSAPLALRATDTDSVTSNYGASPVEGTTPIRAGRLRLVNFYGSEVLKPRVEYRAEYWDGNRWLANSLDSTTTIAAANIVPGGLTVATVGPLANGIGFITFNVAAAGSYDTAINLNASGSDTSCNTGTHGGTAANKPWLQGFWSGSCNSTAPWAQDPNARIRLGSPKAPYIYLRERY